MIPWIGSQVDGLVSIKNAVFGERSRSETGIEGKLMGEDQSSC